MVAFELGVDTPEVVEIGYTPAGIGSRSLAALVDYLAVAGMGILYGLLIVGVDSLGLGVLAAILAISGLFVLVWGYFILYETIWSGQTPGKRAMRIRVIKTSGYPITFTDAVIRNLVRIVDFLPSFYGVGMVAMFVSPQARRLGDYAAGTVVVKEAQSVRLEDLRAAVPAAAASSQLDQPHETPERARLTPGLGENDPDELAWDVRSLSDRELAVVHQYLDRAPSLPIDARRRLGEQVAARVAERIGARQPLDPVAFLTRVLQILDAQP